VKNNKKAFTLIELLVVVLIIGILAAIALPQYLNVVAKSRLQSLLIQTREIRQAINMYYLIYSKNPANFQELDAPFTSCPTTAKCCFNQDCYQWMSNYIRIQKPLPGLTAWQCDISMTYNGVAFCYVYNKKGAAVAESLGFTPRETNCTGENSAQCSYFIPVPK
jgi:type II secretion system protein G